MKYRKLGAASYFCKGWGAALPTHVILCFAQLTPPNHIPVAYFHDMVVSFCLPLLSFDSADSNAVLCGVRCSISCITILRGFMDFEHVGVKTTEFMAATSECRKVFFGSMRLQAAIYLGRRGSSCSCCFTSDCILLHHVVAVNGKSSEACRCGVLNAS